MTQDDSILTLIKEEFDTWKRLLDSLDEAGADRHASDSLSIKDVVAHLMAWQQLSNARFEAAQRGTEPVLPDWSGGENPDDEEWLEAFNARIYEHYRHQPWAQIRGEWQAGFLRLLALAEALPGPDLMDTEKYAWLNGYSLVDVLRGSYEHHREHRESLLV